MVRIFFKEYQAIRLACRVTDFESAIVTGGQAGVTGEESARARVSDGPIHAEIAFGLSDSN